MLDTLTRITRQVRRPALAAVVFSALVLPAPTVASLAAGPDTITPHLLDAPAQLQPAEVEAVFRTLSAAFRPDGAPALEASLPSR